jgi:hypothetical protein
MTESISLGGARVSGFALGAGGLEGAVSSVGQTLVRGAVGALLGAGLGVAGSYLATRQVSVRAAGLSALGGAGVAIITG